MCPSEAGARAVVSRTESWLSFRERAAPNRVGGPRVIRLFSGVVPLWGFPLAWTCPLLESILGIVRSLDDPGGALGRLLAHAALRRERERPDASVS
jgi:predicted membrane protein